MAVDLVSGMMAGLQIIKFVTAQMERHQKGELTDEELQAAWAKMGIGVTEANALWEAAGG